MPKRTYYRVMLDAKSALSIGSADSEQTDNDIVLDSRGLPLIPATSLCGVLRESLPAEKRNDVFGFVEGDSQAESALRIYDFTHIGGNGAVSVRDNVALDNKVPIVGAKFDRQIVEPGARFLGFVEIVDEARCNRAIVEAMLSALDSGAITLGSKTTRGFGRVGIAECKCREFNMPSEKDAWLQFDLFSEASWRDAPAVDLAPRPIDDVVFDLKLKLRGAISIREYFTTPNEADFGQMSIRHVQNDQVSPSAPVIPGSSWAGAFRERFEKLSSKGACNDLFGFVAQDADGEAQRKSRIVFSESVIEGGGWKEISRNSIDRFTGGTKDGALFTEMAYFGGRTTLQIRIRRDALSRGAEMLAPLLSVIADMHNGFLAIGGLAAVGHGLFQIVSASMSIAGHPAPAFQTMLMRDAGDGLISPDITAIVQVADELLDGGVA